MQITTEIKKYTIIAYTGTHYLITAEQEIKMRSLGQDEEIRIDGNTVKMKNIAEILTIDKYYETYPEKRENYIPIFFQPEPYISPIKEAFKHERNLKFMIKELKNYIGSKEYQGTDKPIKLLKTMENKLKSIQNKEPQKQEAEVEIDKLFNYN